MTILRMEVSSKEERESAWSSGWVWERCGITTPSNSLIRLPSSSSSMFFFFLNHSSMFFTLRFWKLKMVYYTNFGIDSSYMSEHGRLKSLSLFFSFHFTSLLEFVLQMVSKTSPTFTTLTKTWSFISKKKFERNIEE